MVSAMVDRGNGGPWEWRSPGMADPNRTHWTLMCRDWTLVCAHWTLVCTDWTLVCAHWTLMCKEKKRKDVVWTMNRYNRSTVDVREVFQSSIENALCRCQFGVKWGKIGSQWSFLRPGITWSRGVECCGAILIKFCSFHPLNYGWRIIYAVQLLSDRLQWRQIVSAASQWLAGNIRPSSKAYPFKDRNIAAKFR